MSCLVIGCFKGIVVSDGFYSVRVQWFYENGSWSEDSSAMVTVMASSRQHRNSRSWYSIIEGELRYWTGLDFKSTLQDFIGGTIIGFVC